MTGLQTRRLDLSQDTRVLHCPRRIRRNGPTTSEECQLSRLGEKRRKHSKTPDSNERNSSSWQSLKSNLVLFQKTWGKRSCWLKGRRSTVTSGTGCAMWQIRSTYSRVCFIIKSRLMSSSSTIKSSGSTRNNKGKRRKSWVDRFRSSKLNWIE